MISPAQEYSEYLTTQLITYIGTKRHLLEFIGAAISAVMKRLNKNKLSFLDAFTGSGIVPRFFKQFAEFIIVNDIEKYSEIIAKCYLSNKSELDIQSLRNIYHSIVNYLTQKPLRNGFITELYAPKDDNNIQPGERVFYTHRNAMYLDTASQIIGQLDESDFPFFLAPL